MSRNLVRPFFPVAPVQYSQRYMASLVEAFSVYLVQQQNPGEARATGIVLTGLQSHNRGLEAGEVFHVDGVLHITQLWKPFPEGLSGTGAVGSVSVTTP